MLSREFTNPVFTDIAFGSSYTYGHWRWTSPQYSQRGEGAGSRGPASKDPILLDENLFFNVSFLEIKLKNYEKIDCSGVLAGDPRTF